MITARAVKVTPTAMTVHFREGGSTKLIDQPSGGDPEGIRHKLIPEDAISGTQDH